MQFFLMLNAAAAANSVTCPMYVQWAGNEVLTCRSAAELWRHQSHSYVTSVVNKQTRRWGLGLGDIPGALWVLFFGRKGAEEGSRSSNYGAKVVNRSGAGGVAGAGVRGRLRKLREFKWEEVKDGAMHVMIHGRRGPVLVACIRNWILQQIGASAAAAAAVVTADPACADDACENDKSSGEIHEDHACGNRHRGDSTQDAGAVETSENDDIAEHAATSTWAQKPMTANKTAATADADATLNCSAIATAAHDAGEHAACSSQHACERSQRVASNAASCCDATDVQVPCLLFSAVQLSYYLEKIETDLAK